MAPGGTLFRFTPHFGENVLPHGSHEWLPYSKDEVRLKTVNNNLPFFLFGQRDHLALSSQKATALAAATFRESTPWLMGMRTVLRSVYPNPHGMSIRK